MSDDFGDRRDNAPSTRSFEEWLEQQADRQDISREELFERLISSYWTLNEMIQLLDDSGNNTSLADISPGDRTDNRDDNAVSTAGRSRENDADDPPRDRRADPPNDRRRDPQNPQGGRGGEPQDDRRREQRDRASSRERDSVDPDLLADLRDRVDQLESELDAERERGQSLDGLTEVLAGRLTELESDLAELESESESTRESLSAAYEDLAERLDDLETTLGGRQDRFASEQERIRSRLNAEFDDLETILEYLVSQTDELDAKITDVEGRYDEEVSKLKWERSALQSLKHEAAELDAHAGECESCGERIDLDLLTVPYCQQCDALLTGIEEEIKWLFFSDVVVTTDKSSGEAGSKPNRSAGNSGSAARSPSMPQRTNTDRTMSTPDRSDSTDHRSSPAQPSGTDSPQRGGKTAPKRREKKTSQLGGTDAPQRQPGEQDSASDRRVQGPGKYDASGATASDRTSGAESSGTDPAESSFQFGDFGSEKEDEDDADQAHFGDLDALRRQERDDE